MKKLIGTMIVAIVAIFAVIQIGDSVFLTESESSSSSETSQGTEVSSVLDGVVDYTESSEHTDIDILSLNIFDDYFDDYTIEEKFAQLRIWFADGKYWNTYEITEDLTQEEAVMICSDQACNHSANGTTYCQSYWSSTHDYFDFDTNIQCLAFASMISDFLFGEDAEITEKYGWDNIQVGDHVRLDVAYHSFIVLSKTDDEITVVEVNANYENCMIEWDRVITKSELESYTFHILSRY